MVVTRMITLQGIYGREMFETWNAMSAMLSTSETLRAAIARTITDVLPATEWERGFALAKAGTAGNVVLARSSLDGRPRPAPPPPRTHVPPTTPRSHPRKDHDVHRPQEPADRRARRDRAGRDLQARARHLDRAGQPDHRRSHRP